MRILLVNTRHYYGGGDSTYTFGLAEMLKSNGHEVAFFAMQDERNLPDFNSDLFVSHINFRELNTKKNPITGLKVLWRSIYSIEARIKFRKLIERFKPDIIHLQNIHAHITPSIIFEARSKRIPIVWTLHDYKFICPNTHLLSHGEICESCEGSKFYNCFLKKCKKDSLLASFVASVEAYIHKMLKIEKLIDMFISPSEFLKRKFVQYGWEMDKIEVINNFLNHNKFENCSNRNENYVLYFGQLEPWKGVLTLLRSAKELPNIKFVILGTGSSEGSLKKIKSDFNLTNVFFEGFKTGEELKNIIKNSSFVILPSEWFENYPYTIMESMAFGKPVIASNIGGITELVINNKTGFLFEKGDYIDLKEKVKTLFQDRKKLFEFGSNAYEFALNNFNENLFYRRITKIYSKCIN